MNVNNGIVTTVHSFNNNAPICNNACIFMNHCIKENAIKKRIHVHTIISVYFFRIKQQQDLLNQQWP